MPAGGSASVGFSYRFDAPGDHAVEVRAPATPWRSTTTGFWPCRCVRRCGRCASTAGRPAAPSAARPTTWPWRWRRRQGRGGRATMRRCRRKSPRKARSWSATWAATTASSSATSPNSPPARPATSTPISKAAATWSSSSATRCWPTATTASWAWRGEGRAGGLHVLPAQIGPLVDRPQFRLDPLGYRHPILQAFRGRGQTSLLTTPVFKHYKLVLPAGSPAATVLELADGDPLIVEQPVHRGRVVLVATSAEPSWTALPLWPSFVPLVQEMVAYCAAGQLRRRNVTVGEPLEALLALPAAGAALSVQSPDGRTHPVQPRARATTRSSATPTRRRAASTSCGPVRRRSATRPSPSTWIRRRATWRRPIRTSCASQLWPGIPFTHQTSWQDAGAGAAGSPIRGGSRLHVDSAVRRAGIVVPGDVAGMEDGIPSEG